MAANYNLELIKNSTFVLYLKYRDEDNNVVDLSGYTAELNVVPYYGYTPSIIKFASSPYGVSAGTTGSDDSVGMSGGITMNVSYTGAMHQNGGSAATGGIYMIATPKTTIGVTIGDYIYDFNLYNGPETTRL